MQSPHNSSLNMLTVLNGATVLTPQGMMKDTPIQIQHGKIKSTGQALPDSYVLRDDDTNIINLNADCLITPGLIDLQLNGAFGTDFSTGSIPNMQHVLDALPQYGVTGVLPTLVTAPLMDMVTACNTLEEMIHLNKRTQSTRVLGIHLEGPFLNQAKRGTHPAEAIQHPSKEAISLLLSPNVKMMTYAPEHDTDMLLLNALKQRGILPFAGHTNANRSCLRTATECGLQGMTHLFNAMEGFSHRKTGTALHALNDVNLYASIIADGHHIHPDMVELVIRLKGDRLVLVSDAMALAGLPEGAQLTFTGQQVTHRDGKAINEEGNLAGGVQLLPDMIRNLIAWEVCSTAQVFKMATELPAQLLGVGNTYGKLAPGYAADLVLWHQPTMQVLATWIGGNLSWCNPALIKLSPETGLNDAIVLDEDSLQRAQITL
jgi:N-acetylglucosamine-6-phosphate deacetylase